MNKLLKSAGDVRGGLPFKILTLLHQPDLQSINVIPRETLESFFGHWGGESNANLSDKAVLSPVHLASLDDPLATLAPPHHQGRHQEGDQDGHSDEGAQDAVGRVPEEAAGQRAVVEVVPVDADKEVVHQPVGPEASHLQRHQEGAVRQLTVDSA